VRDRDDEPRPAETAVALEGIIDEVVGLFHLLRALAEQLHGGDELTAGRRGVLRSLDRLGAQTVPQLARARPVSRQHIQMLVHQLEADRLVELRPNAAHKRSRLVALTATGKAFLEAMYRREAKFYTTLDLAASPEALRSTSEILHAVRETLMGARLRLMREGAGEER
jgi:DNA-binding MarR family transcriptional regulator